MIPAAEIGPLPATTRLAFPICTRCGQRFWPADPRTNPPCDSCGAPMDHWAYEGLSALLARVRQSANATLQLRYRYGACGH